MNRQLFASSVILALLAARPAWCEETQPAWQELTRLREVTTRGVPALWSPKPQLKANSRVTLFEAKGPGVVTAIHCSAIGTDMLEGFDSEASQGVLVRVYYDGQQQPAIEMPWMDFLADVACRSAHFGTVFFSKTKESHNFRLPMPFREKIVIELENPSEHDLVGYADVQWERAEVPADCGYLRTDYRTGTIDPDQPLTVFEADHAGTIVAHWLQYESAQSPDGGVLCESDQELYLDGDTSPTLNYLGTEDLYGFSWGYQGTQSDGFCAIIKQEQLEPAGSRIGVLRCRQGDSIAFQESCRWLLTYLKDQWTLEHLRKSPVPYRHCVYYYARD